MAVPEETALIRAGGRSLLAEGTQINAGFAAVQLSEARGCSEMEPLSDHAQTSAHG